MKVDDPRLLEFKQYVDEMVSLCITTCLQEHENRNLEVDGMAAPIIVASLIQFAAQICQFAVGLPDDAPNFERTHKTVSIIRSEGLDKALVELHKLAMEKHQ